VVGNGESGVGSEFGIGFVDAGVVAGGIDVGGCEDGVRSSHVKHVEGTILLHAWESLGMESPAGDKDFGNGWGMAGFVWRRHYHWQDYYWWRWRY
jgi:hypothetical protein